MNMQLKDPVAPTPSAPMSSAPTPSTPAPFTPTPPAPTGPLIGPHDVPYLPRGVFLATDRVRGIEVLQAPERATQLDATGVAILSRLDGARSLAAIVADLAACYAAPEETIAGDVRDFLTTLIERRVVFLRGAP